MRERRHALFTPPPSTGTHLPIIHACQLSEIAARRVERAFEDWCSAYGVSGYHLGVVLAGAALLVLIAATAGA